MELLTMQFSLVQFTACLLGRTMFSNIINMCSSFNISDQVSHFRYDHSIIIVAGFGFWLREQDIPEVSISVVARRALWL